MSESTKLHQRWDELISSPVSERDRGYDLAQADSLDELILTLAVHQVEGVTFKFVGGFPTVTVPEHGRFYFVSTHEGDRLVLDQVL